MKSPRFAAAVEGLTDFKVIKNILVGFFNDKNLAITKLVPENKEAFGWGNLLNYLSSDRFKKAFGFNDYIIVQIDSGTCNDWNAGLAHIGDDEAQIEAFVENVTGALISKIDHAFYKENKYKIIFAISVHDMECWLLPFISVRRSDHSKMINCTNAVEQIAQKRGFSINQKNYENGKHYEDLSKDMSKNKILMKHYKINRSLAIFIESLIELFPDTEVGEIINE